VASANARYSRMPALLTRMCRSPHAPVTRATVSIASASRDTSACSASSSAPGTALRIRSALASQAAASLSTKATRAPCSQNSCAVADPIPPAPPVTMADLPASLLLMVSCWLLPWPVADPVCVMAASLVSSLRNCSMSQAGIGDMVRLPVATGISHRLFDLTKPAVALILSATLLIDRSMSTDGVDLRTMTAATPPARVPDFGSVARALALPYRQGTRRRLFCLRNAPGAPRRLSRSAPRRPRSRVGRGEPRKNGAN
jgi:hypothetical protein